MNIVLFHEHKNKTDLKFKVAPWPLCSRQSLLCLPQYKAMVKCPEKANLWRQKVG